MNHETHKKKTVSALKWNTLNQVITQVVTFGIGILLMRLLEPEEFGLLGMVTIFSGFMAVFNNFGLGTALIQKKQIDEKDKSTIFFVNILIGVFLTILLFFGSKFIASFYKIPELESIAKYISLIFTIQAFGMVHSALLKKDLQFKKIFIIRTSTVIIGGAFALYFALNDFGVWTLVYQQIITVVLGTVLVWLLVNWKPKLMFSVEHLKIHLKFSLPLLGTNTFNYWMRNADNLLIGKFLGSQSLGLYSRAYNLMMLPITQISRVISVVMMPSFSLIQDDKERIKAIYLKISRVIAFVTFPMMGILFVAAQPLVAFAFGDKWMDIVFLLKVFSLVGALGSIFSLNGNIYISQGETSLMFKINFVSSIITFIGFVIGLKYGIKGVAISYLITILIKFIPNVFFMGRLIDLKVKDFFLNLQPFFFISFLLIGLGVITKEYIDRINLIWQLIVFISEFIFGWLVLFKLFVPDSITEIKDLYKNNFKR